MTDPASSLTRIAYELGFQDPSSFTRAFRRWTGFSPRSEEHTSELQSREKIVCSLLLENKKGRRVRNRRHFNILHNTWPDGYSMPIAVPYTQDAFSRSGWLCPVVTQRPPSKTPFPYTTLFRFRIAYELGFQDPSSFTRAFRRWTGFSP